MKRNADEAAALPKVLFLAEIQIDRIPPFSDNLPNCPNRCMNFWHTIA